MEDETQILEPLNDQEIMSLMLARQGVALAPIGNRKDMILALHKRGYLDQIDKLSYRISDAGLLALESWEAAELIEMRKVMGPMADAFIQAANEMGRD